VVLAHLTFDSVKRRYTVAEATALRNEVADLIAGPAILVNFEPQGRGAAARRQGEGGAGQLSRADRAEPESAVHHLQVANVLLEAGMGEAARAEARLAVKLDPTSALAEKTLAEILKHDLVGRNLRAGSDWPAPPRPIAPPSSSIPTITRRRATWPFCWNTIPWGGVTAARRT
jgi:hypothetical protein